MTASVTDLVAVRTKVALHSRAKSRQEKALVAFIADYPIGHRLRTRGEVDELLGYLPFTEEADALRLFAEVSDQLELRARLDSTEKAYDECNGRILDLVVAAIRADDEAASR